MLLEIYKNQDLLSFFFVLSAAMNVPLEIIYRIFTYLDLPDLRKLLRDQVLANFSSYAVRQRAKSQAWEVAVLTPAAYAAALCHGNANALALARLRCVGCDGYGRLCFEPVTPDEFRDMCDQLPETLKLCWTRRLTAAASDDDEQQQGIRIMDWSQGDHLVEQGGVQIRYRCKTRTEQIDSSSSSSEACRMCGGIIVARRRNNRSAAPADCCDGSAAAVQVAINRMSVTFKWMDRQL